MSYAPAKPDVTEATIPCEGDCTEPDGSPLPTLHRFDFPRRLADYNQLWFKCTVCSKRRLWGTAHHGEDHLVRAA